MRGIGKEKIWEEMEAERVSKREAERERGGGDEAGRREASG